MRIYIFPGLIDFVTFLVMLRVADASGREMHLTNLQAAYFMVVFSLCFLTACLIAGHLLNRRNARPLLLLAILLLMTTGVPLFFTRTFWPTLYLFGGFGFAVAFAFNSFQTFMRGEADPGGLGVSIARFTGAWSTGVACGCLLGGVLKDYGGPGALGALVTAVCLGILVAVSWHKPRGEEHASADGTVDPAPSDSPPVDSRYVAVGWMLCLSANFSQRPLTTFIPKFSAESHHPAWVAGFLLFLYFIAQAACGSQGYRLRRYLYRPRPIVLVQVAMVALLALVWLSPWFALTMLGMAVLGVLYGCMFFSAVYYVSNDVRSSRNVGLNEAMVGVGNIGGMLLSESSMRLFHYEGAYYPATMVVTLLIAGAQLWWLKSPWRGAALVGETT